MYYINEAQRSRRSCQIRLSGFCYRSGRLYFDFIIGTAYMKIKEFEKSIEPFKKALAKSPENLGTLNSLGTACIATGRSGEAISYYQKALELNPKNPMAYYNIGSAFQIQQNHEEACKYFRKAVELDNEDEGFNIALAMSMVK